MPQFTSSVVLPAAPAAVFAFFRQPQNLLALAPPEIKLELLQGPAILAQGARLTWKARRFGLTQTVVTTITTLEEPVYFVEEQSQGPFRRWRHERRFEPTATGTRLVETIDFDPPGGMLGLYANAERILKELEAAFVFRTGALRELFP